MKQTKHIKMLLIAVLALLLAIALVACNGDKKNKNDNNSSNDNSFDDVSETELCVGTGGIWDCGTEEQWREIKLGSYNEPLENATIYYFSELPNNDGQHWHWNAQNKPEVWK